MCLCIVVGMSVFKIINMFNSNNNNKLTPPCHKTTTCPKPTLYNYYINKKSPPLSSLSLIPPPL